MINVEDNSNPWECPNCNEDEGRCQDCKDAFFEPPEHDDSMDGQGEVEWESPL